MKNLSASVDCLTDSIADRVPLLRGLLLLNSHFNLHWAPVPFTVNRLESK